MAQKKINVLQSELNSLLVARDSGFQSENAEETIKNVKKALAMQQKELKRKKEGAERQQKQRDSKKQKMSEFLEKNPQFASELKIRTKGKPRIEDNQPDLLKVRLINIKIN